MFDAGSGMLYGRSKKYDPSKISGMSRSAIN
jgi:hypothetical protein